jgi:hypothetical protein
MKLLSRLDVNPLGDRQHFLGKAAKRSIQREKDVKERTELKVKIPDHTRKNMHGIREIRNIASPSPNTPLLKRLVKYPQTMEPEPFNKIDMPKIKPEVRPERQRFAQAMKMRHEGKRDRDIKKMRPMELHIKPYCVKIPTIENWLHSKNKV